MRRHKRRLLSILALAALCPRADGTVETPQPSDSFVDSVGVNIHARHTFGPYNDWTRIEQTISDIGIRSVRDIPDRYDKLNELSAATGVKIDVIMQDGETTPNSIDMNLLPTVIDRTKQLTSIGVLEGP